MEKKTSFQQVAEMNAAFGNPKGSYDAVDYTALTAQCKNILDEYNELTLALINDDPVAIRDALCDIQVFAMGAQHLMGVDGDADMKAVVDGVMTRFIKDADDLTATIALHAAKGVTKVYFEGEFPKMVMKSAEDQPDAPKGQFLKSASYQDTVFPAVPVPLPDGVEDEIQFKYYYNSNNKKFYTEIYDEGKTNVVGQFGDQLCQLYKSGRLIKVAVWSDTFNGWIPTPAKEVDYER